MRNKFLATSFALVVGLGLVAGACSDSESDGASGARSISGSARSTPS